MRCLSHPRRSLAAALAVAAFAVSPLFAAEAPAIATRPSRTFDLGSVPRISLASETQEWHQVRSLLTPGDLRKLDSVYVRFNLQAQFSSDPERDPFYDRTRETVRSGYMKMYREIFERQYPLDDLVDEVLAYRASTHGSAASTGPSWRLKLSPRLAAGGNGYVGARLSLPHTGIAPLEHLNLNLRRGFFDSEWAVGLRYSNGPRFLQLERVAGDPKSGERYTATVALRF